MYPEVEQFIAALDAADTTCEAARKAAYEAFAAQAAEAGASAHDFGPGSCPRCEFADGPAGEARSAALNAADEAFDAASAAAWKALGTSGDPLVAWIAANARDHEYEAIEVLRMLPASMDALDALARENEWCGDWGDFRAAAKEDGVLPAPIGVVGDTLGVSA